MKNKKHLILALIFVVIAGFGAWFASSLFSTNTIEASKEVTVKRVASTISADGAVTAENQATLHFQTGGKLASLPVKEGDKVYKGQTIATLDTYALEKNLQIAANSYQISQNNTDQTNQNNQAGVIAGQQRVSLDTTNKNSYNNTTEETIIDDAVKRFVDNAKLANNTAQLSVDLANYVIQLATITSPLNGVVTHEDVSVPGVNVTTTTSFVVADPSTVVFRANVSENDIDFVSVGADVLISVDGSKKKIEGIVSKIYPAKVTLANGQSVYQVDIQSNGLKNAKLDQAGNVLIASNTNANVTLVPVWTVLAGKYIWVDSNGETVLKQVTVGKIHGTDIEITSGLSDGDKIIVDPKVLTNKKYLIL